MTNGGLPPEAHSDHLTLMETALDAMVATDPACLPMAELLDRACRLQRLTARLDAARATMLAAADSASDAPGVLRELGFRTASQVVAAETGAPAREIHSTARTGQWLEGFPVFAQAAADGVLTLRHLRELKSLDKPDRRDALLAYQDTLVAAARDHDFVEFANRLTVWLINHTTSDEVTEQVKKTSCTWNTNTDGSIDGRFHLDPLSAAAVGTALGDEMQRLFRQQSEGAGKADTLNRRRGQALVGLIVGGAEAPGSATTTPLVNLVIGQRILENFLERFVDPDTVWSCFASPTRVCRTANSPTQRWIRRCLPQANSGLPGTSPAKLRSRQQMEARSRGLNKASRAKPGKASNPLHPCNLTIEHKTVNPGHGGRPMTWARPRCPGTSHHRRWSE